MADLLTLCGHERCGERAVLPEFGHRACLDPGKARIFRVLLCPV